MNNDKRTPSKVILTIRGTKNDRAMIRLAAALEGQSMQAWALGVLQKEAQKRMRDRTMEMAMETIRQGEGS